MGLYHAEPGELTMPEEISIAQRIRDRLDAGALVRGGAIVPAPTSRPVDVLTWGHDPRA